MVEDSKVKAARKHKGWSQYDLADRAGLSQPIVSLVENGLRPSRRTAEALAEALDLPLGLLDFRELVPFDPTVTPRPLF